MAPNSASTPLYQTQIITCPVALPLETEGKTVTCGVFTVPENYARPHGRQVEINYVRLRSSSLSPLPDPVFYLAGGPGNSAVVDSDILSRYAFDAYRLTRDVVLSDQRGNLAKSLQKACNEAHSTTTLSEDKT